MKKKETRHKGSRKLSDKQFSKRFELASKKIQGQALSRSESADLAHLNVIFRNTLTYKKSDDDRFLKKFVGSQGLKFTAMQILTILRGLHSAEQWELSLADSWGLDTKEGKSALRQSRIYKKLANKIKEYNQ